MRTDGISAAKFGEWLKENFGIKEYDDEVKESFEVVDGVYRLNDDNYDHFVLNHEDALVLHQAKVSS